MYKEITKKIETAVKAASKIIPSSLGEGRVISKDGRGNFATEYDLAVQRALIKSLKEICPEAYIIGEEDTEGNGGTGENAFVIDPIDGTTNFMHNMKKSAISVAYAEKGIVKSGVVFDPYLDEMFTASYGGGAYLNGEKISVSERNIEYGVVFFGASPYYDHLIDYSINLAGEFLKRCTDIRRLGVASLELCYVACGRGEAQFELVLSPWDYSAAQLIITEAGGIATDMKGRPLPVDKKSSVMVSNKVCRKDVEKIINLNPIDL
ncbi:MAG: inositol monophosphatase [Clostridia bacterium]|nr:inositol monophosphatase [Clostridia bacterium]